MQINETINYLEKININKNETNYELSLIFNFNSIDANINQLLDNNLTGIQIKLRRFNVSNDNVLVVRYLKLINDLSSEIKYVNNTANISSSSNSIDSVFWMFNKTYKLELTTNQSVFYSYDDSNHLNKIHFNIDHHGNYILCYMFVNSVVNSYSYFHTPNMCADISIDKHNEIVEVGKYLYYKPLFILIMYSLCALMFVPIVTWQHMINKQKKKKKQEEKLSKSASQQSCQQEQSQESSYQNSASYNKLMALLSSDQYAIANDESSKEPLLNASSEKTNKVHFDTDSLCDNNEIIANNNNNNSELNENDDKFKSLTVDHILDAKPWLCNDSVNPLTDSKSSEINLLIAKNTLAVYMPSEISVSNEDMYQTKSKKKKAKSNQPKNTALTKTVSFSPMLNEVNELSSNNDYNYPEPSSSEELHKRSKYLFSYETNV